VTRGDLLPEHQIPAGGNAPAIRRPLRGPGAGRAGPQVNFLAHCLLPELALPQTHPDLVAGGFFGDFVKGPVSDALPPHLAAGIRLHRRLDAYSNSHPAIRASCERFPAPLRRLAPVVVDVVADHLLARAWSCWYPVPLPVFSAAAYAAIEPHLRLLPEHGQRFYRYAQESDLFGRYADPDTLAGALESVARRLRRPELGGGLVAAVHGAMPTLADDFRHYFPDLVAHTTAWLRDAGYG
jgi:acyl carrier protein phosphodiesterase